jgi:hypothetical protein
MSFVRGTGLTHGRRRRSSRRTQRTRFRVVLTGRFTSSSAHLVGGDPSGSRSDGIGLSVVLDR